MRRFFRLLKYLIPYKWYVVQNVTYNILGAFFAIFSFAMVVPFLRVLFDNQPAQFEPMEFELSTDYLMNVIYQYMGNIIETRGSSGALILVVGNAVAVDVVARRQPDAEPHPGHVALQLVVGERQAERWRL